MGKHWASFLAFIGGNTIDSGDRVIPISVAFAEAAGEKEAVSTPVASDGRRKFGRLLRGGSYSRGGSSSYRNGGSSSWGNRNSNYHSNSRNENSHNRNNRRNGQSSMGRFLMGLAIAGVGLAVLGMIFGGGSIAACLPLLCCCGAAGAAGAVGAAAASGSGSSGNRYDNMCNDNRSNFTG